MTEGERCTRTIREGPGTEHTAGAPRVERHDRAFGRSRSPDSAQASEERALAAVLGLPWALVSASSVSTEHACRTVGELQSRLGIPQLGRVPEPARRLRADNGIVMLAEPLTPAAEPYRILATNLEFVNNGTERGRSCSRAHEGRGEIDDEGREPGGGHGRAAVGASSWSISMCGVPWLSGLSSLTGPKA